MSSLISSTENVGIDQNDDSVASSKEASKIQSRRGSLPKDNNQSDLWQENPLMQCAIDNVIEEIKNSTNIEIETFIHGAMCYCYSGMCLMSSILGGRSGNRGKCAQPCRLPYHVSADNLSIKDSFQKHVFIIC